MPATNAKILCVIPARYASTRLPGKPLLEINGLPLVMWAYKRAVESSAFEKVVVATDDERIMDAVTRHNGVAMLTSPDHPSGTDRANEIAESSDCTYVVNLQGDEPDIPPKLLQKFAQRLQRLDKNSLLTCISHATIELITDPSAVKVVVGAAGKALYFSRSPIPYNRSATAHSPWIHVGLYGFSRESLQRFCSLPRGHLERVEMLEQLRALEHGMNIYCMETEYQAHGIDTPQDLRAFRLRMQP